MPLIGFGVGNVFYPNEGQLLVGHFLVGATPVAVTSVVWTGIAGGNVALVIAIVASALGGIVARNRAEEIVSSLRPYLSFVSKVGMVFVLVVNGTILSPTFAELGRALA